MEVKAEQQEAILELQDEARQGLELLSSAGRLDGHGLEARGDAGHHEWDSRDRGRSRGENGDELLRDTGTGSEQGSHGGSLAHTWSHVQLPPSLPLSASRLPGPPSLPAGWARAPVHRTPPKREREQQHTNPSPAVGASARMHHMASVASDQHSQKFPPHSVQQSLYHHRQQQHPPHEQRQHPPHEQHHHPPSSSRQQMPPPFLTKTYQLVDDSSTDEVVSWGSECVTFVVWKPMELARDLLPTYFKHNNFSSFVRQLNTYVRQRTWRLSKLRLDMHHVRFAQTVVCLQSWISSASSNPPTTCGGSKGCLVVLIAFSRAAVLCFCSSLRKAGAAFLRLA